MLAVVSAGIAAMFEVGHITTDNKRTTLRGLFTLQGEFADDWQWDASLGYGKSPSVNSGPTKLTWSRNARRWMPNMPQTA